jgi:hypothetical protein
MKHFVWLEIMLAVFVSTGAFSKDKKPPELEEAVLAIEEIQNLTETGVSYYDYVRALPKVTLAVKRYAKSSYKEADLEIRMERIVGHYKAAGNVWEICNRFAKNYGLLPCWQGGYTEEMCHTITSLYPKMYTDEPRQIDRDKALPFIWKEASKEIEVLQEMIK